MVLYTEVPLTNGPEFRIKLLIIHRLGKM